MARRPRNNKTKNQREIKTKAYPPGILDKLKTILNDLCQTVALPPQIVSTLKNTISATLGIDSFSKIHNEISLFSASFAQEWKTNCTIAHTDLFIQDLSDSLLLPDLKNHDRSNCFNKEINSLLVSKYYSELQINKSSDSTWNEIKASIIKQHFGLKINSPVFLVENFYSSTDCIDVHEMVQNVQLASDRLRWNILKYHFMRALNIIKELPKLEIKVKESQDDVDSKFVEFQVENTVDMNQGVAKAVESDSSASERGSLTNTKELEIESTCLIAPEKVISISNKKNEHEIESTRLIVPEKIASISNTIESNRVIVAEKVTSISKTIEHEIDIKSTRVFEQAATFSNTNEQEIYIKSTQLFTPATTISNTNEQEIKSTPVYSAKQPYSWTHPVMEPYKKACHEPFAKPNCKLDKVHDFVSFIANELDYKKELSIKQIEADVLAFNGVAQIIYASCFATGSFVKRNDHNSFENLLIAYKFAINSKDNKRKKRPFQEINVPNFKLLDYDGKPKTLKLDKLPFVCLLIGDWIIQKRGIETNQELLDIAFSFYLQSVNRHYLPGLISCALMIGSGDKKIEKYVMLPIYMNVSIEFKDSFSMSKVGYLYREALRWFLDSGDFSAIVGIAQMRLDSKNESLEVLVKSAATFRTASSFNRLGDRFLELKNFEQAVQWKELAANSGNVDAQYFIGLCLREGYYGVEKDLTESFNYFKMAAEKGHQEAQKELSVAFNNGIGTAIDKKNGKKWQNAAKDRLPTQTKFRPTLDFGRNMDSLPELSQFAEFQRDLSCQYLKKIDHPIYNIDDLKTQIFQFKDNLHLQCVDINHPEHELMLYICRSLIKFKDFVHETDYKGAIGELAKVFKSYTGIFSLKNFGLKLMAQTCVVAVLMTHAPEFLDQTKNCVVPDASLMKASDPTTNPFVLDKFMANKPNRNINKDLIQDALLVDLFINVSSRPIDLSLIHLDFLFKEYPGNLHATLLRAKLLMATGNSGTALLDFNACALYCNEPANDKFWETDILGKQVYLYKIELLFSRGSLYTLCKKYNIAIVDLDMCIQMSRAYSFSRRIVDAAFIAASCYLFIEDLSKFKTYYEMGVKERTIRAYKEEIANPDLALRLAMEYQYVAKYNKLRLTSWKLQDKDLSKTIAIALNRIDKSLEKFSISKMCKYCGSWEGSQVQHYCSSNCQILDE